jgi:hypothetical protein
MQPGWSVVQSGVLMLIQNSETNPDIRMDPWHGVQNFLDSELVSYLITV